MSAPVWTDGRAWRVSFRMPIRRPIGWAMAALIVLGSVFGLSHPAARVIYNASASAPLGFYWLDRNSALQRGALVLAWAPSWARRLAAERGYLPFDVPLVKRIVALRGDRICAHRRTIFLDGHTVATRVAKDREGRGLPHWHGCRVLGRDELLLLMAAVPDSFDGRYFGPIRRRAVIGRLTPLWTW